MEDSSRMEEQVPKRTKKIGEPQQEEESAPLLNQMSEIERWVHEYSEELHQEYLETQTRRAAEAALKYFYFGQNVKYEIVNLLNSNAFYCSGNDVVHANFTAKKVYADGSSGESELYFAEGYYSSRSSTMSISDSVILDPEKIDEEVEEYCHYCSKDFDIPIRHAVEHYRFGKYDEDHYSYPMEEDSDDDGDFSACPCCMWREA